MASVFRFICFSYECSIVLAWFLERLYLFCVNFAPLSKIRWLYLYGPIWGPSYTVPLICWSILLPIPVTWNVVLEKTLESPLDCKEIKPVNPKEINPEYSLERLMLKQKHQYFGHLMWRVNSLEKTLILGKIEVKKRSRQQRMRWLDSITDSVSMNLSKLSETVNGRIAWRAAVHGAAKSQTWLSDWTITITTVSWLLVSLEVGGLVPFNCFSQYWIGYSGFLAVKL